MPMSHPLQGDIYYEIESSYKAGFSGSQLKFSDAVLDARIETGDINIELMSISQPSLVGFVKAMEDPTLHVEYILQPHTGASAVSYFYQRTNCDLSSFAIEVGVNTCSATSDSYYYMRGCKPKSFTVSSSKGEAYKVSVDFSVASLHIRNSAKGSTPTAIGTAYATFNNAGSITWAGVTGAYVTESFEFTVDNNITDYYDVGSTEKKSAIPGAISIKGSCDISMDDGGQTHFDEVIAGTDITSIILNTGIAVGENSQFTLYNGRFDSTSIDVNTSSEGIMSSVPFTFERVVFGTGS